MSTNGLGVYDVGDEQFKNESVEAALVRGEREGSYHTRGRKALTRRLTSSAALSTDTTGLSVKLSPDSTPSKPINRPARVPDDGRVIHGCVHQLVVRHDALATLVVARLTHRRALCDRHLLVHELAQTLGDRSVGRELLRQRLQRVLAP